MQIFDLALSFEWHQHAATNEYSIHKNKGGRFVISFKYSGWWYSLPSYTHGNVAFADFLTHVIRGPIDTRTFNHMPEVEQVGDCPVILNTDPKQYLILKMAAKDPMALDLLEDILRMG